jgi:hypothetical protein
VWRWQAAVKVAPTAEPGARVALLLAGECRLRLAISARHHAGPLVAQHSMALPAVQHRTAAAQLNL